MCSEHGFQCIPSHPLSDKTVVEVDFVHLIYDSLTDFENRYYAQIRRYYDDRSKTQYRSNKPRYE